MVRSQLQFSGAGDVASAISEFGEVVRGALGFNFGQRECVYGDRVGADVKRACVPAEARLGAGTAGVLGDERVKDVEHRFVA